MTVDQKQCPFSFASHLGLEDAQAAARTWGLGALQRLWLWLSCQEPLARVHGARAYRHRAGAFADLDDAGREEAIERAAGPLLVETEEFARFSARVTGVGLYQAPDLPIEGVSPTTWLPEIFTREARLKLEAMPGDDLAHLAASLEQAIGSGAESVDESGLRLPARKDVLEVVRAEISRRDAAPETPPAPDAAPPAPDAPTSGGPAILQTRDNFHDVQWRPALKARAQGVSAEVPSGIVTPLKPHQHDSLRWQAEAWSAGLPGILNADEQGLGKTLQTISVLAWLHSVAMVSGPHLVIVPLSTLANWCAEFKRFAPQLRVLRLQDGGELEPAVAADEVREAAEEIDRARAEEDYLRHALGELDELNPEAGEEDALAARRTQLMHREKVMSALATAASELGGEQGGVRLLSSGRRTLERIALPNPLHAPVRGGELLDGALGSVTRRFELIHHRKARAEQRSELGDEAAREEAGDGRTVEEAPPFTLQLE